MEELRKKKSTTIILVVICFTGLSLLLYPTIADYWNSNYVSHVLNEYTEVINTFNDGKYIDIWDEARKYNEDLRSGGMTMSLSQSMLERYFNCLNITDDGLMGYVEIDKIGVMLPVYHDTSDSVLVSAIGHISWTSLPTGGPGTHCVISGHRGLPSAKLFSDLDDLREGDVFTLNILDETLTYEIDQIRTVLPTEIEELLIVDGMDYCTLLTCTPYGINTHRLLVRGHRIENKTYGIRVISEAVLIDPLIVAIIFAIPILLVLLLLVFLYSPVKPEDTNGEKAAEEEDAEWIEEFMNKLSEEDKQ